MPTFKAIRVVGRHVLRPIIEDSPTDRCSIAVIQDTVLILMEIVEEIRVTEICSLDLLA